MDTLAIDLAKHSFHVHGVTADGRIVSRRVGRSKLLALVESLAPNAIAMEACATSHFWARAFMATGRRLCLINPRFVKPFARGSKNGRGRRRGDLRRGIAADHALRPGEDDRAAGSPIPASGA